MTKSALCGVTAIPPEHAVTPLVGPDAIPADATTNLDILRAQERTLELAMGLRQPGPGELRPGEVPRQNNIWNNVDRAPIDKAPLGPLTGNKLAPE